MERSVNGKRTCQTLPTHQAGITLIELMIVIVVVAILGSIAVPSYQDFVVRSNRMEAINVLLDTAACQERVYIKRNQYDATGCNLNGGLTSVNGLYTVTIAVPTTGGDAGQTFILSAAPAARQNDPGCGTLTLNEAGQRGVSTSTDANVIDLCWRGKKVTS